MLDITSNHWDKEAGCCLLHGVPMTPCPQCLADEDPEVRVWIPYDDKEFAVMEDVPLRDFFPEGKLGDFLWSKVMW